MTDQVLDRDVGEGLVARVVQVWRRIADVPEAFTAPGVTVAVRQASQLCPRGWAGVVRLRDSALAVVPDEATRERLEPLLTAGSASDVVDPAWLRDRVGVDELMGPAELGYADAATATLVLSAGVRQSTLDEPAVERLLARVSPDDLMESGVGYVTSPMFVVRDGDLPVAVAGYRVWASRFAHLSLLTDPDRRGEGLGRKAASAAAAHALGEGLVLQWRARPVDSRAVGRALGFVEFGTQVSFRPAAG